MNKVGKRQLVFTVPLFHGSVSYIRCQQGHPESPDAEMGTVVSKKERYF